jgi:hypothetical protein
MSNQMSSHGDEDGIAAFDLGAYEVATFPAQIYVPYITRKQ